MRKITRQALALVCLGMAGLLLMACVGYRVREIKGPGVSRIDLQIAEHPVWSPGGGKIAVSSQIGGGEVLPVGHILIVDVASGESDLLLRAPQAYRWVQSWSPDGKELAYSDMESIWAVQVDDGEGAPRWLSQGQTAVWSPSGKQMAIGENARGTGSIWILDLASGDKQRVFSRSDGGVNWGLSWSPDGTRLAFAFGRRFVEGESRYSDIYILDLATHTLNQLTDGGFNQYPTWSPDGRMIAYVARDLQDDVDALVIARADGSCRVNALEVAEYGYFSGTAWSPDGSQIAFCWWSSLYLLDIATVLGQDFLSTGPVCP